MRRKQEIDADYIDQLYSDVTSLYHLDQISASETSGKADLGPLPVESKILLVSLGAVWFFLSSLSASGKKGKAENNFPLTLDFLLFSFIIKVVVHAATFFNKIHMPKAYPL